MACLLLLLLLLSEGWVYVHSVREPMESMVC